MRKEDEGGEEELAHRSKFLHYLTLFKISKRCVSMFLPPTRLRVEEKTGENK
jgi:hypothetical protein